MFEIVFPSSSHSQFRYVRFLCVNNVFPFLVANPGDHMSQGKKQSVCVIAYEVAVNFEELNEYSVTGHCMQIYLYNVRM